MKKFWLVGLIIAAMAVPELLQAQVEVGAGTLQIGGKVKWGYTYMAESEDAVGAAAAGQVSGFDGAGIEQFATTNVEIDINGTVGEKVAYVIELQSVNGFDVLVSNPNEIGAIGVRQAKIMFKDVIPMTTVTVGTFNLPVSIYQPRATNDYDLIVLPLLNLGGAGNAVGFYGPMGLGWQATGVNFAIMPADMVELDLSYFNGNAGGGANTEIDLEKSWLVNLKIMPAEGAMISIGYLTEGWQENISLPGHPASTEQQNATGWVVSGAYDNKKLEANFDYVTMTAKDYQFYKNKLQNLTSTGYQVTVGYWFTDAIEALVRYENVDPNTANTKKTWAANGYPSEYDQISILTLGANYRVTENSEVSVNYLFITEQGDEINVEKGKTPLDTSFTPPVPWKKGKYQSLDNDTLLIQVQVWQ
ncbi:MAG TPA: hypothetical protein VM658_13070 [bacterium]|nr:hypothetical protein [bacterium]